MSPSAASEADTRNPEFAGRVWLLRVRWLALAGCAALAAAVELWGGSEVPAKAVFLLLAVASASNVSLWLWLRAGHALRDRAAGSVLLFDILLLTAILALTGGASNPFGSAYLLYVAVGALLLPPAWTLGLVTACVAAYSGLFWLGSAGHASGHHDMRLHLMGMWMAFVVVGPVVAYAVTRLRRAVALAEEQLARSRAREERAEKLASLATLAAGAAHELATPLATISVAARELERRQLEPGVTEDARLIRDEVERCSAILARLAIDAGAGMGEAVQATQVGELVEEVVGAAKNVRVTADSALLGRCALLPRRMLVQALRGLVKNAQQASAGSGAVELRAHADARDLVIEVEDTGCGMSEEVSRRVGEPFFTTKPPGQGMGLGVFFARSLVEHLGGALEIRSDAGRGTLVVVRIPWEAKA